MLGFATRDRIRVIWGDTDQTPVDLGSYSSRVTLMMGHAAIQAAEDYFKSPLTARRIRKVVMKADPNVKR